jgi:hypothetical protein
VSGGNSLMRQGRGLWCGGSFDFATFFASEESRSAQDDRGKEGLGALLRMTGEKKDWVVR